MSKSETQSWIRKAACEIGCHAEIPYGCEDEFTRIIARHAPKPEDQPIRRGDVVQWTGNCHPKMVGVYYIVKHVTVEKGETYYGGGYGENYLFSTAEGLIRIGRAKFYPDGSKVED